MRLGPLDLVSLGQFIADTLHRDPEEIASLSRLVKEKTDGNPFFVTQFLKSLHHQGLIQFDEAKHHWTFRAEEIANAAITDNVVDLMAARIHQLSKPAQEAVKIAACFGAAFDLSTLAGVQEIPVDAAAANLHEAIEQGLILPIARTGFQDTDRTERPLFTLLHDRVQQAAYESISPERRELCHLRIGRLLLSRSAGQLAEKELFTAVSHFNLGRQLITEGPRKSVAFASQF